LPLSSNSNAVSILSQHSRRTAFVTDSFLLI
jgi:hypothetical protein